MKKYFLSTFLLLIILPLVLVFHACIDEEEEDEDCDPVPYDCVKAPYSSGSLSIRLTINSENPIVKVHLFEGDVEDENYFFGSGIVDNPFDWSSSAFSKSGLPFGSYSAKVDYKVGSVTVTAIDGDSISSTSSEHCGNVTCYGVDDAEMDLTFDMEAFRDYLDGTDEECFIATAAFGSPLAKEVVSLRNFRDTILRRFAPGRMLIELYYRHSPRAASVIRKSESLRAATRAALYPVAWSVANPWSFLGVMFFVFGLCAGGIVIGRKRRQ